MAPPRPRAPLTGNRPPGTSHPQRQRQPQPQTPTPPPAAVSGTLVKGIFQSAADGDLRLLKRLVTMLVKGRGRPKEAIEALRVVDAGDMEGLGVLHIAASRGSLEVCKYLVEELQVDVNAVDKKGRTPLLIATRNAVGIAKYLLDHGADPNKACHEGLSPLHLAAESGDCETVKLLLAKGADIDSEASCGTPLHCAATTGHDGTMKVLLDHNADYNKMVDGQTPIIAAMHARSVKCMWILIEAGADINGPLTDGLKNLQSQNLISSDFANGILEDMTTNRRACGQKENQSTNSRTSLWPKRKSEQQGLRNLGISVSGKRSIYVQQDATVWR